MFFNAFQNVCRFRDIKGKKIAVLAPKISNYLNSGMIRLRSISGTIPPI